MDALSSLRDQCTLWTSEPLNYQFLISLQYAVLVSNVDRSRYCEHNYIFDILLLELLHVTISFTDGFLVKVPDCS